MYYLFMCLFANHLILILVKSMGTHSSYPLDCLYGTIGSN